MNIAFVLQEFPVTSQTFVYRQIDALVKAGHKVSVLAKPSADPNISKTAVKRTKTLRLARETILVRHYSHFKTESKEASLERYENTTGDTVIFLIETLRAKALFVSTHQGVVEYLVADARVAFRIAKKPPSTICSGVQIIAKFVKLIRLRETLESFGLFIATRLRIVVPALSANTPIFPIACRLKTHEAFRRLGAEAQTVGSRAVTSKALMTAITSSVQELSKVRESLSEVVTERNRL